MTSEFEGDFTIQEQLTGGLVGLAMSWQEMGVDPDSFLRCGACKEFFIDPVTFDNIPCGCSPKDE